MAILSPEHIAENDAFQKWLKDNGFKIGHRGLRDIFAEQASKGKK